MRILFVNHAAYRSGAENSLLHLIQGLDPISYQLFAVCPPDGPLAQMLQSCGVMVHTLPLGKRPSSFFHTVRNMTQLIHHHHIDLIHANSIDATQYAAIPARFTKIPLIGHVRNIAPFRPHGRWFMQQAYKLVAVSEATRQSLIAQKMPPAKVEVIYNGVDTVRFQPSVISRENSRQMFQLPVSGHIIGSVGRLHPIKGFEDYLAAAKRVVHEVPDAYFVIAGSDPEPDQQYAQHLHTLANQWGLNGRIHFLGEISDIDLLLPAFDIFVLSSHQEPFARAILEAMSSGCAIVATAVGGTPEAIEDGFTGLLVPSQQPDLLAAAILKIVQDHKLAQQLRQNARDRAVAQFSISINIQRTMALYEKTRLKFALHTH